MKLNEYIELTNLWKVQNYGSGFPLEGDDLNNIPDIGIIIINSNEEKGNEIAIYEKGEEYILVGEHLEKFYGVRINKETHDIL